MRGISTRGTGCRQSLRCNAQKNTRQRLNRSADSPRVIFLRSEKPGERGGAPNSAEIYTRARKGHRSRMLTIVNIRGNLYTRVKGQAPLLAKHIRKSYPNGARGFFQLCRRSAARGHPSAMQEPPGGPPRRYIKHCRQSARRHCTGRQESPRPLPWGCFSASACILSVYGKSQKTPAQKGRPGAIRPEITKIMSKKTQSKKSAPSALYFYRNCDNFSTLQTLYISPILYRKRAPTILISRI